MIDPSASAALPELITQSVAAVAAVAVVVVGALKGIREWGEAAARKAEGVSVVPAAPIEQRLTRIETKLEELLLDRRRDEHRLDDVRDRVLHLEARAQVG